MNEENEVSSDQFYSELSWFGFIGKPSPGVDYFWLEVQNCLQIIGCEEYILNCKLFSSSRNSHIFMIRKQNGDEEIWDISEVNFSNMANDSSTLIAAFNNRCIHISNVSTSFIDLLMRAQKLPYDSLSKLKPFQPIPFKIKKIPGQLEVPEESSKLGI